MGTENGKTIRNTKIICTIGPATSSPEMIESLIKAGMDVARLNFSHGAHETHQKVIENLRKASATLGKQVGIMQDLSGPKIRLGTLNVPSLLLVPGQNVVLFYGEHTDGDEIPVNYPYLVEDIQVGNRILLADGFVELKVDRVHAGKVYCTVINKGVISSHKGVNIPFAKLRISAFTDKDRNDLEFGLRMGIDFVAMSFVRNMNDLIPIRDILDSHNPKPLLLAKIEKPEAVEKLDEILSIVDGIMVARGDLGVETSFERLPIVQKKIISSVRRNAKPVITATQMLRSMIDNPRPTRAEATDTANAILDGTSALMLSEETASGLYPIEAVKVLDQIAKVTEEYIDSQQLLDEPGPPCLTTVESCITRAGCLLVKRLDAACIIVVTHSGASASLVARFLPNVPIIAITDQESTWRKMPLIWGVIPFLEKGKKDPIELASLAFDFILGHGIAKPGQRVILVSGYPAMEKGNTDMIKVLTIPDS